MPVFAIEEHKDVPSFNPALPTPSLSCNLGGVLSVSANGNVMPCGLTLPSGDPGTVPSS